VAAVERAVPGAGPLARVTASAGSACYPDEGETLTALLGDERSLVQIQSPRSYEAASKASSLFLSPLVSGSVR